MAFGNFTLSFRNLILPQPGKSSNTMRLADLSGFLLLFLLVGFSHRVEAQLTKFQLEAKGADGEIFLNEGMMDAKGEVIIPAEYEYIWNFANDTITLARKRLVFGNKQGIAYQYELVTAGGYLFLSFPLHLIPEPIVDGTIRIYNLDTKMFGFISVNGDQITKYKFSNARDFSEGMAAVLDGKSQLWGYINGSGKIVIEPSFEEAFSFSEGLALVKKAGKHYFCKPSGQLIEIEGSYDQVYDLQEGFSVVSNDKGFGFINAAGKVILAPKYDFLDNFEKGIAVFVEHNDAGIISNKGEVLIEARYDEIFRFDQQHYLIQQNGLKGLINTTGDPVIPAQYSVIDYFSEGLAPVMRSGKWGFADTKGEEIIPCQFAEYQSGFLNGKVQVRLGDRWRIAHGNDTLELPNYDEVLPVYGYTAAFRKENLWGFLNLQGEESIEPKYSELIFNKGGLVFGKTPLSDGSTKFALINAYGKEIVEPRYAEVVRFAEGYAAVRTDNGWGFINENGSEVIPPQYDEVRNFSSGRAAVRKADNWGFISGNGTELIPMFTKIPDFQSPEFETKPQTFVDSLNLIRETFPLFLMEVVGDFNGSIACVEDLTLENSSYSAITVSKTGKVLPDVVAEPFQKIADPFDPKRELNLSHTLIQIPGKWITINELGIQIE